MMGCSSGITFDKKNNLVQYLYTDADFQVDADKLLTELMQKSIDESAELSLTVEQAKALIGKISPGIKIQLHGSSAKDISVQDITQLQEQFDISGIMLKKDLSEISYYYGQSVYNPETYKLCRAKIDSILSELDIDNYKGDSDRDKKVFTSIIKRLADASYDWDTLNMDKNTPDYQAQQSFARDMRSVLLSGKTLCSGYADALYQLLSCCDIESDIAIGVNENNLSSNAPSLSEPGHIWNQVKLNGKWYNVDLTGSRDSIIQGKEPWYMLLSNNDFYPRSIYSPEEIYYEKHKCDESISSIEIVNIFYGDEASKLLKVGSIFAPDAMQDFRLNYSYTKQQYMRPIGKELSQAEKEWEERLQRYGKIQFPDLKSQKEVSNLGRETLEEQNETIMKKQVEANMKTQQKSMQIENEYTL